MKVIIGLFILYLVISNVVFGETHNIELSQQINVEIEDVVKTKDGSYSAVIKMSEASDCAVPGFNCGAGYRPSAPYIEETCKAKSCDGKGSVYYSAGKLVFSLENEESCLTKKNNQTCFHLLTKDVQADKDCNKFNSHVAKYYCLNNFDQSNLKENRDLCDKLPSDIYGLKWNCFYEWAIRYKDPSFCEQYSKTQLSGKNRCYLKMAVLFNSNKYCKNIEKNNEDSYLEQCLTNNYSK